MENRRLISLVFILCFFMSGCTLFQNASHKNARQSVSNKPPEVKARSISTVQWFQDIDLLSQTLKNEFPNLLYEVQKKEFDKKIDDLKNEVSKLTDEEINMRLIQIVAFLGDVHTSISMKDTNKSYPINLYWFGNDLRVFAASKDYDFLMGAKLVKINNIPIDEIINKVNTLISHSIPQQLLATNVNFLLYPQVLKYFEITKTDEAEWAFEKADENIITSKIVPVNPNSVKINRMQTPKTPVKWMQDENDFGGYWYKYVPEDKILYMSARYFIDKNTVKQFNDSNYEKYPEFDDFARGFIKTFEENDAAKIVIDMRYYGGGDTYLLGNFINRLIDTGKVKEKKKAFIIVGRNSTLGSMSDILYLKQQLGATIFGESISKQEYFLGFMKQFILPNSKLVLNYSSKKISSDDYNKIIKTPLNDLKITDVAVEQSFDDFVKGIDDAYEAIKAYQQPSK